MDNTMFSRHDRKIVKLFFLFCSLLYSFSAFADVKVDVHKLNESDIVSCAGHGSQNVEIQPPQVENRLVEPNLGYSKQAKGVVPVFPNQDLKEIFQSSLVTVLKRCGYQVKASERALKLTVYIDEFFGGARNKFLTGKSNTKIVIEFSLQTPDGTTDSRLRFIVENKFKGLATQKIKRLEKNLNLAFVDLMNQIAMSPSFVNGVRDLSESL